MSYAMWLLAAVPLAAQPKLLTNAVVDVRTPSGGLAQELRALVASGPQPAWIGYSVPASRSANLGCDYVRGDPAERGVVYLEPPGEAVILLRVEAMHVERIRALSPRCEIDAGGLPLHWIDAVKAGESVALLSTFATDADLASNNVVMVIAAHAGSEALEALIRIAHDGRNPRLRQRAISTLGSLPAGAGVPALVEIVRTTAEPAVRKQAIRSLEQTKDPRAVSLFEEILKR